MDILLALLSKDVNLPIRRVANTDGGEFAGPCPSCGGTDRFRIWPQKGRYWCRGCGKSGDAIGYLKEFRGMTFQEACETVGMDIPKRLDISRQQRTPRAWTPKEISPPSLAWQEKALAFLEWGEQAIWSPAGKRIRDWLHSERGLTPETIKSARLGWWNPPNPQDVEREREEWGLPPIIEEGKKKKLYIPPGIAIPTFWGDTLIRLRIRKFKVREGEKRYHAIAGSEHPPMLLGEGKAVIVVESELDAILLQQEAGDLVGVVALGSVTIRPDKEIMEILSSAGIILVALDNDKAGVKEAWGWWQEHFRQARRWPVPIGKDPSEAWQGGLNLRNWIITGLIGEKLEEWDERTAIIEFDGNFERRDAERLAMECIKI